MLALSLPLLGTLALAQTAPVRKTLPSAESEHFEKEIRPRLWQHCVPCHSTSVASGGVRFDGPLSEELRKRALAAIRHEKGVKAMPPSGKLSASEQGPLTKWLTEGALWPEAVKQHPPAMTHWALVPPTVRGEGDVDKRLARALSERGLRRSPEADCRTLLRRLSFDLIGLPPTEAEYAAFLSDTAPDAYAKQVDRLLASPHFGERWARHWLDLARYSDTRGDVESGQETRYPFAWVYRDWVISALNDDLPYDRFIKEQLAGDLLPGGSPAALGFLTLGRAFYDNTQEIVDDRIDVLTRTTQGLSVSCARCHNHKFDPIPTKDYYSLYGILNNSRDRLAALERVPEFEQKKARTSQAVQALLEARRSAILQEPRGQLATYLLAAQKGSLTAKGLNREILERWRTRLEQTRKDRFHYIFGPWHAFAKLKPSEFSTKAPALAKRLAKWSDDPDYLSEPLKAAFAGPAPRSLAEVAQRYERVFQRARAMSASQRQKDEVWRDLYSEIFEDESPMGLSLDETEQRMSEQEKSRLRTLRRAYNRLLADPSAPLHAHTLKERPKSELEDQHVFFRGNADTPSEKPVPRQYLTVLSEPGAKPFIKGSGRGELAKAIASPKNPLTARVLVNRVWAQLFGAGLVRTPSDFGTRGEPPTHPELLDSLAVGFMEKGWRIKALIRELVLTKTYRQSSAPRPEGRQLDPDNRLLWRQNPKRLEAEAVRDSLLVVSGELERDVRGGRPVGLESCRRTLYTMVDRSDLSPFLRAFDFPSPDLHASQRFKTSGPQQGLLLLNHPFVLERARALARQATTPEALYRRLYGRTPDETERKALAQFLATASPTGTADKAAAKKANPWRYGFGSYDPATKKTASFTPFGYWTGGQWQRTKAELDPEIGGAALNAGGGTPGDSSRHAVIRRWVSPVDGVVSLYSELHHEPKAGDGVRARVVHSRLGLLGEWVVHYRKQKIEREGISICKGDTLDFIVDCRADDVEDYFSWSPYLEQGDPEKGGKKWSAEDDFSGPSAPQPTPLTPWERLVHTHLLAPEFLTID